MILFVFNTYQRALFDNSSYANTNSFNASAYFLASLSTSGGRGSDGSSPYGISVYCVTNFVYKASIFCASSINFFWSTYNGKFCSDFSKSSVVSVVSKFFTIVSCTLSSFSYVAIACFKSSISFNVYGLPIIVPVGLFGDSTVNISADTPSANVLSCGTSCCFNFSALNVYVTFLEPEEIVAIRSITATFSLSRSSGTFKSSSSTNSSYFFMTSSATTLWT